VPVSDMTASIDILPSLLELLSIKESADLDGTSLFPFMEQGSLRQSSESLIGRQIYLETFRPVSAYGLPPVTGIRSAKFKFASDGKEDVLFDLSRDPLEIMPILDRQNPSFEKNKRQLQKVRKGFSTAPTEEAYFGNQLSPSFHKQFKKLTGINFENNFLEPLSLREVSYSIRDELKRRQEEPLLPSQRKKYGELIKEMRENLNLNPRSIASRINLANLYQYHRIYETQAISEAYLALKQDPFFLQTYLFIAQEYARTKTTEKTEALWQLAQETNPDWVSPYLNLALMYESKGESDKAREVIESLGKEFPHWASGVWVSLAGTKIQEEAWDEAEAFLYKALQRNSQNMNARATRALVRLRQGKIEKALEDFDEIRNAEPEGIDKLIYQNIVFYAKDWRDVKLAERLLSYLEKTSDSSYWPTLGQVFIDEVRNNIYSAIDKLKRLAVKDLEEGKLAFVYSYIGNLYVKKENYAEAKEFYEKTLEIEPYSSQTANNYAWIVGVEDKDIGAGLKWIYRALSRDPRNAHILDTLAELNFIDGKSDVALKIQREVVRLDPNKEVFKEHLTKYQEAVQAK